MIRRKVTEPIDEELLGLLNQARQFLLGIANDELPAVLRAKAGASDLVQETFASAVRDWDQFRGSSFDELRAWLRTILLNKVALFHRSYTRVSMRDTRREVAGTRADSVPSSAIPTLEALIRKEKCRSLAAAVVDLPGPMRDAVVLRVEQELSFAEIGDRLGRSEEAARKLFTRALDRLRGCEADPVD